MDYDIDVEEDSDSSESSDQETQDKYASKYEVLNNRCEAIQKENQMIVARLMKIKKRIHQLRKERQFLMDELDKHDDDFRNVPINVQIEDDSSAIP